MKLNLIFAAVFVLGTLGCNGKSLVDSKKNNPGIEKAGFSSVVVDGEVKTLKQDSRVEETVSFVAKSGYVLRGARNFTFVLTDATLKNCNDWYDQEKSLTLTFNVNERYVGRYTNVGAGLFKGLRKPSVSVTFESSEVSITEVADESVKGTVVLTTRNGSISGAFNLIICN